jgi:hypothetical protein
MEMGEGFEQVSSLEDFIQVDVLAGGSEPQMLHPVWTLYQIREGQCYELREAKTLKIKTVGAKANKSKSSC